MASASPASPPTTRHRACPRSRPATASGPAARTASRTRRTPARANLPYSDAASNAIRIQVVLLAMDLSTWAQQLALTGTWRVAQPKALRLKLFSTAARYVTTARRRIVDIDPAWPWAAVVHDALKHLAWLARLAPA